MTTRRMIISSRILKATDTLSDSVMLIAFPRQFKIARTRLNVNYTYSALPVLLVVRTLSWNAQYRSRYSQQDME
jgi:hypothetical protein